MTTQWIIFVVTLFASCGAFHIVKDDILAKLKGIGDLSEVRKVLRDTLIDTTNLAKNASLKPLIHNLLQKIIMNQDKALAIIRNRNDSTNGCACVQKNCGCCAHVEWKKIKLDETICMNVSYLPAEIGFRVTLTIGKHTIINETASVKNPPPICADIPHLKRLASICIRFHDLDVTNSTFKGCIAIEARLAKVIAEDLELGCFNIPVSQKIPSKPDGAQGYKLKVTTHPIQTDDRLYFKPQRKYGSTQFVNLINP